MAMHASEIKPKKVDEAGEEFLEEWFQHHLGCGIFGQSVAMRTTDEETQRANPFEVAGGRFEAELLRRFRGEATA